MTVNLIKRILLIHVLMLLGTTMAFAETFYSGAQPDLAAPISVDQFTAQIPKGSIVIIGEQHNFLPIQKGQMSLLQSLRNSGHKVNVGMEFLKYPDQQHVDNYRSGKITEDEFKKLAWGESNLNYYRDQMLFPEIANGETTFAINSPKELPIAVKTKGLANLTDKEKALLPPNFQVGGPSYRERFIERMAGHVSGEEAMNRYFEAQSVWDDTMAWKICEAAKTSANTLVIVVGQFHVEHGDGLVARIRARCSPAQMTTVFQYLFFSDEEVDLSPLAPSEKYGPLSDYLMIVKE